MKKSCNLKELLSNLELEGQGRGIIMGVTRLLLLELFYTIQSKFMYYFAHDCRGLLNQTLCPKKYSWLVSSYLYVKQVASELGLNFFWTHSMKKQLYCFFLTKTQKKKKIKKLMLIVELTNIGHHLENKVFQKFKLSVMSRTKNN